MLKWLLIIPLLLGGWLYHDAMASRLALAESELQRVTESRDMWQQSAEALGSIMRNIERDRLAARQAVQQLQHTLAEQDAHYSDLRKQIRQRPAQHDGPVAPVLRDAIEALP